MNHTGFYFIFPSLNIATPFYLAQHDLHKLCVSSSKCCCKAFRRVNQTVLLHTNLLIPYQLHHEVRSWSAFQNYCTVLSHQEDTEVFWLGFVVCFPLWDKKLKKNVLLGSSLLAAAPFPIHAAFRKAHLRSILSAYLSSIVFFTSFCTLWIFMLTLVSLAVIVAVCLSRYQLISPVQYSDTLLSWTYHPIAVF